MTMMIHWNSDLRNCLPCFITLTAFPLHQFVRVVRLQQSPYQVALLQRLTAITIVYTYHPFTHTVFLIMLANSQPFGLSLLIDTCWSATHLRHVHSHVHAALIYSQWSSIFGRLYMKTQMLYYDSSPLLHKVPQQACHLVLCISHAPRTHITVLLLPYTSHTYFPLFSSCSVQFLDLSNFTPATILVAGLQLVGTLVQNDYF